MSGATEYQPVSTTTERTESTNSCYSATPVILCLGFLFLLMGIPVIIFGSLQLDRVNRFITEPALCRVNAFGTERIGTIKTSGIYAVWNVDIVRQPTNNDLAKNFTVLRSSLLIRGTDGSKFLLHALEKAKMSYSVSY